MASTAGAGAKPRGRRGRRGTVCAPPVMLEAGWKPKVVAKSLAEKARYAFAVLVIVVWLGLCVFGCLASYMTSVHAVSLFCTLLVCSICEVVANNILFAGLDDRDRDVIVDAMEEKSFSAVRDRPTTQCDDDDGPSSCFVWFVLFAQLCRRGACARTVLFACTRMM